MNDKKNIDRLFQEKFKDFEVTPDPAVWDKIKTRKKQKRRVLLIPFWYRVAGVAALLAILVTIGYLAPFNNSNTTTIVDAETIEEKPATNKIISNDSKIEEGLVNSDTRKDPSGTATDQKETQQQVKTINSFGAEKYQNSVVTSNTKEQERIIENRNIISETNKNPRIQKSTIAENTEKNKLNSQNPETVNNKLIKNSERLAENRTIDSKEDFIDPTETLSTTNKQEVIANNRENKNSEMPADTLNNKNEISPDPTKKSIFDAINEQSEEKTDIAENTVKNRWYVTPNVAPVYYDALGNGSSVKEEFSDNSKDGEFNMSYGIQVAYQVSPKLSIRSGVHKLDLSYNTEDVGFGIAPVGFSANDGNGDSSVPNIVVSDFNSQSSISNPGDLDVPTQNLVRNQNPGVLNHSLSYIEVPLEMKYDLVDKKFGVHVIGGVSTLFLNDDTQTIISNGFKSDNIQREEFNVNELSFSGNVGVGFNYKLSEQFQINLEPIFKYQINGFKNSAEDFNPFYVGVYTGISIKF